MEKYSLSKNVTIDPIEDIYDVLPHKHLVGHFIMYNKMHDNETVINESVKYYIDKFLICKTEEEVVNEIEREVQSNVKEIREACSEFFKFLCRRNILVPGDKVECDIMEEPLYKEGDSIDRMRVLNVLSDRRYTDVYSVTGHADDGLYVIKLLNGKKIMSTARFQKELTEMEAEYRMLQKASHITAISKAYGFNRNQDEYAYIILEYIRGKSLSKYLEEEEEAGVLANMDCMYLVEAIINAFSCLHESNIIHGDVHASNILITEENDVKIIDLGMSRNVEPEENEVIRSGGVYFYMPPERINISSLKKFSKEPDLYSDVYQVGLLMYLVLYNALPFDGFTWEELAQNIKENKISYPAVSFMNHHVPAQLVNIIKKCLDKEPLNRYRNASGILADFKRYFFSKKEFAEI